MVLGIAALAAIGAAAQQKSSGGDEAAIAKVRSTFQAAAKAQDAAGIAKLWAPDGTEMPPNAPAVKGRAAIERYYKDFAQQFMVHEFTITPTETKVTGDRAYDVGTYKRQLMPMKGGATMDDHGKYIVLLKREGGTWWLTHGIYNSDIPLPAPPPPTKK
jgi:uncharacterized protein (TIGR02246 family)